jgi:predicted alpha/beta hydrolase
VIAAGGAMADSRTKMAFKEDWSHLPAHLQKNEAFKPMEGEDIKKTHRSLGVRVGGMLGGAGLSGAGVGAGMSGKPRTALALGAAGVGTTLGSMALGGRSFSRRSTEALRGT